MSLQTRVRVVHRDIVRSALAVPDPLSSLIQVRLRCSTQG